MFLAPLEVYIRMMAQVTNTPLHYFDPQTYTRLPPSGESIRAAEVLSSSASGAARSPTAVAGRTSWRSR